MTVPLDPTGRGVIHSAPGRTEAMADPTKKCMYCIFWINKDPERNPIGECHRHAPEPHMAIQGPTADSSRVVLWPRVRGEDLCGEGTFRAVQPAPQPQQ